MRISDWSSDVCSSDLVAGGAANLAYWLIETGDYDESARLLTESLAIRRKALGDNHPQVASTLTVKATLLLATRRFDDALLEATEARRILETNLHQEHCQVAKLRRGPCRERGCQ